MNSYYGVQRSTDHLAHYGVKGMRWGVRKALATGNERALAKHYRKAAKKLAKLQRIGNHPGRSAAKAAAYGAAAIGTGALALGGTDLAAKSLRYGAAGARTLGAALEKRGVNTRNKYGTLLSKRPLQKVEDAANKIENWGKKTKKIEINKMVIDPNTKQLTKQAVFSKNPTNNTLFRIGAAAATAGLGAKAAHHAYRAKNADRYRDKAIRWKNEMDENFAGTMYEGRYDQVRRRRRRG